MSGRREPIEVGAASAPSPVTAAPLTPSCTEHSNWRQERLHEARGILADITQHPDTLVVLACRVVDAHSPDAKERADALGVMRLLCTRSLEPASTARKGGVA